MRTPLPVNDKKSFRDDLFEKLANDYLLKGTSSVLALFLTEDIQESVDRLRKEAGSDGQEALADNVSAIPRFCYYYQLFQENSANSQKVFACFSEILRTIARRSAPFFYEEKFDELYRKMTFVLRGFKSAPLISESRRTGRSRNIPGGRCKSKSALQKLLKDFCRNLPEVQEAYDTIMHERSSGNSGGYSYGNNSSSGSSGSYSYGGSGSYGGYQSTQQDPRLQAAVNYINSRRYREALNTLDQIPERSALWYYLSGCANAGLGNNVLARDHAAQAVNMEPNNLQYRQLLNQLDFSSRRYQNSPYGNGYGGGYSSCGTGNMCCDLCIADQLCECMGGDLCTCM